MAKPTERLMPLTRKAGLVIEELPDEFLVYDLDNHKAHCLNKSAALVWEFCDGMTSVREIASKLEGRLELPVEEELVWRAIEELGKRRLLVENISRPAGKPAFTRRDLMKKMGVGAALAVPVILTITAPAAAQAVTCAGRDQSCVSLPCCSGCNCNPVHMICVGNC